MAILNHNLKIWSCSRPSNAATKLLACFRLEALVFCESRLDKKHGLLLPPPRRISVRTQFRIESECSWSPSRPIPVFEPWQQNLNVLAPFRLFCFYPSLKVTVKSQICEQLSLPYPSSIAVKAEGCPARDEKAQGLKWKLAPFLPTLRQGSSPSLHLSSVTTQVDYACWSM